ncbi:MAG: hypothetical protein Rhob2KO_51570 [Rhodopirellula baltica]
MVRRAWNYFRRRLNGYVLRAWSSTLPKPTSGSGRFIYHTPGTRLKLRRGRGAQLNLQKNVYIQSDLGDRGDVQVNLGRNAKLDILGEFSIGAGTFIMVGENAHLTIVGRRDSTGSGITSNTRIMVNQSMTIGADCIIAWDVFLTDCDWHQIGEDVPAAPVVLGDRTWVAKGASILKGTTIGSDSVVACGSVVPGKTYSSHSLIAGNPARVVRQNVTWCREMNAVFDS